MHVETWCHSTVLTLTVHLLFHILPKSFPLIVLLHNRVAVVENLANLKGRLSITMWMSHFSEFDTAFRLSYMDSHIDRITFQSSTAVPTHLITWEHGFKHSEDFLGIDCWPWRKIGHFVIFFGGEGPCQPLRTMYHQGPTFGLFLFPAPVTVPSLISSIPCFLPFCLLSFLPLWCLV